MSVDRITANISIALKGQNVGIKYDDHQHSGPSGRLAVGECSATNMLPLRGIFRLES
jgi:hypothetical protein